MAFGFSPKYVQDFPLENLTPQQFLMLALEAAKSLGWNAGHTSDTGFVAYTAFSMSSWGEEVRVEIVDDAATLKSECTGNQMVDWGKNKENIQKLAATIEELKASYTPEELVAKCEEQNAAVALTENGMIIEPPMATKGRLTGILSLFKPANGYFVTPIIIDINILIFIVMVISGVDFFAPTSESLLRWGANFRPVTMQGEWWRLITNIFLHIGILHLLFNMYALVYIGVLLEPHLGKLRFAAAYLLTGLIASTTSLYWHENTISAGASGAIFGMYGVFLAMLTTNFIEKSARKALLTSISVFVVFNLINGAKGGIDNAAHIGGLVSGFIIGYLYYPSLKAADNMLLKIGTTAGLGIACIATCVLICVRIPNYVAMFNQQMKRFAAMESMALEVYHMPKTTAKDTLLYEIKDRGLYYWNEDIELVNNLEKLDLPPNLHNVDGILLRYCNLRIKSYNLLYKAVNENSSMYRDSINNYDKIIQLTIDSLKVDK